MTNAQDQARRFLQKCGTLRRLEKVLIKAGVVVMAAAAPFSAVYAARNGHRREFMNVMVVVFSSGFCTLLCGVGVFQKRIAMMREASYKGDNSKLAILLELYSSYVGLGRMAKDTNHSIADEVKRIGQQIARKLPQMTPDEGALLGHAQHVTLVKMLDNQDINLVRAVLVALATIGDEEDLRGIEAAAARGRSMVEQLNLRPEIETAVAAIRTRLSHLTVSSGLLRGSTMPESGTAELLHPVVEKDEKHEDELLRASGGE